MLRTLFRSSHKTLSVLRTRAIHTNGAGEVPKTEANTGSHTTRTPQTTHRTGPKGDGDMPHPQEYVDGIEPVEGNSGSEAGASPEKQPTRSTGIKSGTYERPLLLLPGTRSPPFTISSFFPHRHGVDMLGSQGERVLEFLSSLD